MSGQGGPLLIVGAPRSGTTLLATQLGRIDVAVGPESHALSNAALRKWARSRRRESLHELADRIRRLDDCRDVLDDIDESAIRRPEDLWAAIAEAYRLRAGAAVAGEKTPDHWRHAHDVLRRVPGSRVLFCIRDPRDVADSLRRVGWSLKTDAVAWTNWRRIVKIYERLRRRYPDRVRLHIHERFLMQPEATLQDHAAWLGTTLGQQQQPVQNFRAWERDWKAQAGKAPDASKVYAWSNDIVSRHRYWQAQAMLWPELQRLEYPLMPWKPNARQRIAARVGGRLQMMGHRVLRRAGTWMPPDWWA